jgi:hypothetical protein
VTLTLRLTFRHADLGDWPESVKKQVGHRLPPFTDNDKKLLSNSTDYFCLNSYSASWATGKETTDSTPFDEMFAKIEDTHFKPDGTPIGNPGQPFFLFDGELRWGESQRVY